MFEIIGDEMYDTPSWILDFEPKSALRDLKIKMITTDDIKFLVSESNIHNHKNELDFLRIICPNDIITGSLALNLYGLINRSYNDIDVLIKDKDRYPNGHYYNDQSYTGDVGFSENRLGFKYHIHRKEITIKDNFLNSLLKPILLPINFLIKIFGNEFNFKVDYFIDNNVKYNTFDYKGHTYKIHCPLQIMDQKLEMCLKEETSKYNSFGDKHKKDLFVIFKKINW